MIKGLFECEIRKQWANFPAKQRRVLPATSGGLWHRFRPCLSVLGIAVPPPSLAMMAATRVRNWIHVFGEATGTLDNSSPSLAMAMEPGRLTLSVPLSRRRWCILSPSLAAAKLGDAGVFLFGFCSWKKIVYLDCSNTYRQMK